MNQSNNLSRRYFYAFIMEFPEYTDLYIEWLIAKLLIADDPKLEHKLAHKLHSLMLLNGWG
ncbi:hypothetical protein [Paenibacillus sp. NPDC057934]|uniref:hypothetical protein n=1 Tax=Paenibacillus sp. NPDC057934 TaxID=3346282 RepID=UPI0036DE01B4